MAFLVPSSRAEAVFPCEPSLIFELLTDYDTWLDWVPLVGESKLLAKEGDLALAEISLRKPFEEKVVFECIHDKNRSVLLRLISGEVPLNKIEWTITGTGAQQCQVTLAVEGRLDPRWLLPSSRKLPDARAFLKALKTQVSCFSPETGVSVGGETILEMLETEEGLVLVYRGQKYLLQPMPEKQP